MTRPRRTLTPVEVTRRFPSFRTGRLETWQAVSADGQWRYDRVEVAGTPWALVHVPTGVTDPGYGTLGDARAATANGSALAEVQRILAHERGEHGAQRDPGCIRC